MRPSPPRTRHPPHFLTALALALPAAAALLAYLRVLDNGFVWDEQLVFFNSALYRSPNAWLDAVRQPLILFEHYYRPLPLLTFIAELRFGEEPYLFHLSNLLLHGLNVGLLTLLAYRFGQRLGNDARALAPALLAGAFYGMHPALAEGVSWISCRYDLMLTCFLLIALLADISLRSMKARAVAVAFAFLLAALSKEAAAPFLLVLIAWHLATAPEGTTGTAYLRRNLPIYLAVMATGLVYLTLRAQALGGLGISGAPVEYGAGQHLALVAATAREYLTLIAWPFSSLSPIHHHPLPIEPNTWQSGLSIAVMGGTLSALAVLTRRAPRVGWPLTAAALALLPVVNLIPLPLAGPAIAAEHYLLFPLALVSLAWVPLVKRARHRAATIGGTATALWLTASTANVLVTVPLWHDDRTLWNWAALKAPSSPVPHANLAMARAEAGDSEGALIAAKRTLELEPNNTLALRAIALSAMAQGRYTEALSPLERALALNPTEPDLWSIQGVVLQKTGRRDAAEEAYNQALKLAPNHPPTHANLTTLYAEWGRRELAIRHYRRAMALLPLQERERLTQSIGGLEGEGSTDG